MYFDGPRDYGYGGYKYDGRWKPVARDIVNFYGLRHGSRVLDVGAAKGFLVKDLLANDIDAFGLDISDYALKNCETEVIGRLHKGTAENLPFPDNSFDLVLSINTIHNLEKIGVTNALKEIMRVTKKHAFVQVDSYHDETQKEIFESWVLTAKFHDFPDGWRHVFGDAGYTGDYYWTVVN